MDEIITSYYQQCLPYYTEFTFPVPALYMLRWPWARTSHPRVNVCEWLNAELCCKVLSAVSKTRKDSQFIHIVRRRGLYRNIVLARLNVAFSSVFFFLLILTFCCYFLTVFLSTLFDRSAYKFTPSWILCFSLTWNSSSSYLEMLSLSLCDVFSHFRYFITSTTLRNETCYRYK